MESRWKHVSQFLSLFRPRNEHQRVLKPTLRSRPGTLAAARPTAKGIKVLTSRESQMKPFPLIIPVYIHWIDCLLAAWTAERPAIGSGHHLINALSASSIQSHCITADGQMEGWINNEERERGQTAIDSFLSLFQCAHPSVDFPFCIFFFCFFLIMILNLDTKCPHFHFFPNRRP